MVQYISDIQRQLEPALAEFAELLWSGTPSGELLKRDPGEDVAITQASYAFLGERRPGEIKVDTCNRVINETAVTSITVLVDNTPFVVDSILIALADEGVHTLHLSNLSLGVTRSAGGVLKSVSVDGAASEALVYVEVDPVDQDELGKLAARIEEAMLDVQVVVQDFKRMRDRVLSLCDELDATRIPEFQKDEAVEFLRWLLKDHFVFLGYREFDYAQGTLKQVEESGLGVLRRRNVAGTRSIAEQHPQMIEFLMQPTPVVFSKSGTRSLVHRPAYPDYIGVRRIDENGKVIGEAGILGLYTSSVYQERPTMIPIIRKKVEAVWQKSPFDRSGFDGKVLAQVLDTYPRDELFEADTALLRRTISDITYIYERRHTRVYTRVDPYGMFANVLVYVPKDLYDTHARRRITDIMMQVFDAQDCEFEPYFSEASLVRLQLVMRLKPASYPEVDDKELTRRVETVIRDWLQELRQLMIQKLGLSAAMKLLNAYLPGLPASYRERYSAEQGLEDLSIINELTEAESTAVSLYRLDEAELRAVNLKIIRIGPALALTDIVPKLENLGFRVVSESGFTVRAASSEFSIQDFSLNSSFDLDLSSLEKQLPECVLQLLHGETDDDAFNGLVSRIGLGWRQVDVLRAYGRYLKQLQMGFSLEYTAEVLNRHAAIAADLFHLFAGRFDPDGTGDDDKTLVSSLTTAIDAVPSLNEDRVLRRLMELMDATLRTNFYLPARQSLVLKMAPRLVNGIMEPVPECEIFVSSPSIEGVHLRFGLIARGGLRWSDRFEDYRVEVLGLMKAQVVKNAVIVPTGAKGGFVIRDETEAKDAYRTFVSGLLDVTDNIVAGETQTPAGIRRRDEQDPYLVVAADKGTATFSDTANEVSEQYGFWLHDAFASGGSNGYDHKKLGITARGAWVSVEDHFRNLGLDVATDPFDVLGIGDMAGDVFGNGMLQSQTLRLVAAFNHRHIFVDPSPDAKRSFQERQRLFAMPGSSWMDYDAELLSVGGGVFERSQKTIQLSDEIRQRFEISETSLTPDELIKALLKSPVDLVFNGGIGTYVKASTETNGQAMDRANDHVRIDGNQLQCRVFGEGGNLGLTQLGRIEFALNGGAINTDFIDNCGGVDCSDHEVNLKIALDDAVASGLMDAGDRSQLIAELAEQVTELVLATSSAQSSALTLAQEHAAKHPSEYIHLVQSLERSGRLNRSLECIPADDQIRTRGLTRPELAVLMAYAKISLTDHLLRSDVVDDERSACYGVTAFPATLLERYPSTLTEHPLRREIIAAHFANSLVHQMGMSFVAHLSDMVGASPGTVCEAFLDANAIYDFADQSDPMEVMDKGRQVADWLLSQPPLSSENIGSIRQLLADIDIDDPRESLPLAAACLERGMPAERLVDSYRQARGAVDVTRLLNAILDLVVTTRWEALDKQRLYSDAIALLVQLSEEGQPEVDPDVWKQVVQSLPIGPSREYVTVSVLLDRLQQSVLTREH